MIPKTLLWCCASVFLWTCAARSEEPKLSEHPMLVRMLAENNRLRLQAGLPAHQIDERLCRAAQDQACWMAKNGQMDHYTNGGPSGRAHRWGFFGGVRENIAYGQSGVGAVFNVWRNSGGHWANLCSGTNRAGFGAQKSASGTWWWVSVYGIGE